MTPCDHTWTDGWGDHQCNRPADHDGDHQCACGFTDRNPDD